MGPQPAHWPSSALDRLLILGVEARLGEAEVLVDLLSESTLRGCCAEVRRTNTNTPDQVMPEPCGRIFHTPYNTLEKKTQLPLLKESETPWTHFELLHL